MNGAIQATNKNIKNILRKMIDTSRGWHEMLQYSLFGCQTTVRMLVGATPYLFVYGTEKTKPAEIEISSLRIIQEVQLNNVELFSKRIDQLTLIDEKRMVDIFHGQLYQQRMTLSFHKGVRARNFKICQLVLSEFFLIKISTKENYHQIGKDPTQFAKYYQELLLSYQRWTTPY